MSILMDRIALLCDAKDISIYKIEKLVGLSQGSMRNWAESIPSGDKIVRVANYFDVSVDYLLGNCDNPQSHKTESVEVPFAAELSEAVADLEISVEQATKAISEQTERNARRIKSILQINGVAATEHSSGDKES